MIPCLGITEYFYVLRLVSTVHALIVGLFCLYILWYDDAVNEDPVW